MASIADIFKNFANLLRARLDPINVSLVNKGQTAAETYDDIPAKIDAIETGVDTSDATATASTMLSGYTAYAKGQKITGNIATRTSSNVTVSGATVTVPAGYYASQYSKSVATGALSTPSISVNSSGVITATGGVSTSGYISSGTTKQGTSQLSTQAGGTYTLNPGESVSRSAGTYLTSALSVTAAAGEKTSGSFGTRCVGTRISSSKYQFTNINTPSSCFGFCMMESSGLNGGGSGTLQVASLMIDIQNYMYSVCVFEGYDGYTEFYSGLINNGKVNVETDDANSTLTITVNGYSFRSGAEFYCYPLY